MEGMLYKFLCVLVASLGATVVWEGCGRPALFVQSYIGYEPNQPNKTIICLGCAIFVVSMVILIYLVNVGWLLADCSSMGGAV